VPSSPLLSGRDDWRSREELPSEAKPRYRMEARAAAGRVLDEIGAASAADTIGP
jgi:hypothetical protein